MSENKNSLIASNTSAADDADLWGQPAAQSHADAAVNPYEQVFTETGSNWINGPSAVVTNEAEPSSAGGSGGNAGFADPYSEQTAAADGADNWLGGPDTVQTNEALSTDWADVSSAATDMADATQADGGFALSQLWDGTLPVQDWINQALSWFVTQFRPFFHALRGPVDKLLSSVETVLQYPPAWLMIAFLALLAWQLAGRAMAVGTLLSLLAVAILGIWAEAMVTLSLVLTSLLFCILIGLPLGILLARSDRVQNIVRPILDAMQTTPAFVYLVPVVMLFGIGNVPGVIVTIIFALAPLVRLTNLGIRQVRPDLIEAAKAYGASPWQLLTKVQIPLALPSIMAGINQSLMLSLSMVVIASMIAVGGLGLMVLRGIGRLDMGLATVGGLGIVILAIVLDRLTQTMGRVERRGERWYMRGPIGLLWRAFKGPAPAKTESSAH